MKTPIYLTPNRDMIESLRIGDLVLDPYGRWAEITRIAHRGDDIHGKAYIGFYVRHLGSNDAEISQSYQEGRLVRTLAVTAQHNSAECDGIEKKMQNFSFIEM